jgi:putative nucleotidyltransferase with HDIG domain
VSNTSNKIDLDDIDIPGRPDVVLKVIAMLEDEYCSIAKLEKVILEDPSITAVLLKISNAPLFMTGKSITTVAESIMSIGIGNVVAFVSLAAVANQCLNSNCDKDILNHLLAVSSAASMLAEHVKKVTVKREVATIAGLLHDVGKLVLMISLPKEYTKTKKHAMEEKQAFFQAEEALLGTNHCMVGGALAHKWKLPHIYQQVIMKHHDATIKATGLSNEDILCYLIRIADKLVLDAGIGMFISAEQDLPDRLVCLGIEEAVYQDISQKIVKAGTIDI